MSGRITAVIGLVMLAVLFVAVNIVSAQWLRSARLDLTEGKLFTLTEGARAIARGTATGGGADEKAAEPEPVKLTLYYSARLAQGQPGVQAYGQRVRELLEEFARASAGRITVEIVDPEPFSDAEDDAVEAGLQGMPTGGGDSLYLGLVASNAVGDKETIAFFDPGQERFLEYEVARVIAQLSVAKKPVVGVMSWAEVNGGPNPMDPQGRPLPAWRAVEQLREMYDVRMVGTEVEEIPADVKVLLVIHPKDASPRALYAIDQFVLKGGRLIGFVDPVCEYDMAMVPQMRFAGVTSSSTLGKLLDAWGVGYDIGKVAADTTFALSLPTGQRRDERAMFINYMNIDARGMDGGDAVMGRLSSVVVGTPGYFTVKEGATTTVRPVLRTSPQAAGMAAGDFAGVIPPKELLAKFKAEGKELALAVRVTGPARTAFAEGAPGDDEKKDEATAAEPKPARAEQVKESGSAGINVLLVADVDMLTDRFWLQEQTLGGGISLGYVKVSDNGDLLAGAVDHMAGSEALLGLRARGKYARPLERVEEIRRRAEQDYLAQEKLLEAKLQETTDRINTLQQQRGDGGASLVMTAAQREELEKFRAEAVQVRKQLRDVRLNVRRDIEELGAAIKFINLAIGPALVALAAVGIGWYRGWRRGRAQRAMAA